MAHNKTMKAHGVDVIMNKFLKFLLISFIIISIFIAVYFFYLNNNSTKEDPKRAKLVNANYNQDIEVIYYRQG